MQRSLITLLALVASSSGSPCAKPSTSTNSTTEPSATALAAVAAIPAETPAASSGRSASLASTVTGQATFYGGNLAGGMCSFTSYTLPSNLFGTAFSGSAWDSAAHCGECVEVTGPNGNSITAMIVDQCPECEASHLDLFQDAFTELGSISAGIIDISYDFVSCGITSAISLKNKEGTSKYWFSMQVVNANVAVSKLEVSTDGGSTWQATTRAQYNYFENSSGFGTDTVDVRVTSSTGKTITVNNVSVAANEITAASSNF